MRPIKFRAWDTKNNSWLSDKILSVKLGDWFVYNQEVPESLSYKIIQYTGLKDAHGKEIWEGDIVSTPNGNRIVEYLAPEFSLCKPEHYKTKEQGRFGNYVIDSDTFSTPIALEEVIGNVYEHPDLLTN